MNVNRRYLPAILILGLAVARCGRDSQAATAVADQAPAERQTSPPDEAPLVLDAQASASIGVATIATHEEPLTLVVPGKVQFDEEHVAHVLAPVSGPLLDLRVKVGDTVHKGAALCTINSREASAAVGEHIEGRNDLELAQKTAIMTRDLYEHDAASRIALQQAQNDLAKAEARVERTGKALRALGLDTEGTGLTRFDGRVPIAAPLTGTVIERKVVDGQYVQADNTPIITIADLGSVWVIGDVFERDLHLVSKGSQATVTTAAYPNESFHGRIDYISDAIDPATRTAKVRVNVPNRDGRLKPEMFASIAVGLGATTAVLTIPSAAAFTENGKTWVFVVVGDGRFVRRAVELGPDDGDDRRVMTGVKPGDLVVTDGALLLRQEEEKRVS